MTTLSFVGLSEDGSALVLTSSDGRRYSLPIDERLRSATRSGKPSHPELNDVPIGVKEVQARMRAGATPQEVADLSGWSLDRVTAFAAPVLQERSWIADKAQKCRLGREDDDPTLGDLVNRQLAERGIDATDTRWDSWLRDGGVWTILLAYPAGQGDRVATWSFDPGASTLVSLDDEAHWFTEDRLPEESRPRLLHLSKQQNEPSRKDRPPASMNHPAGRGQRQPSADSPASSVPNAGSPASPKVQSGQSTEPSPTDPPTWDEVLFGSPQEDHPGH